jgi:hypothetical protein
MTTVVARRVRDNNEKQCRHNENNAGTPVSSVLPWAHEKTRCSVPPGCHTQLWIMQIFYKIR